MNTQDGNLQWHPAFSAVLHIEFEDELEHLYFHDEFPLSRQPMRMDILIIKKNPDIQLRKNIGQIFRTYTLLDEVHPPEGYALRCALGYNIIEYKPPGVSLSLNHFYKAYGYACFFQSDTEREYEINPDEITITYVCYHYPRKMLKHLTTAKDIIVTEKESGIYYLEGTFFKMQLLVTSRLSPEQNYWLSHLRNNLKPKGEVRDLLEHYEIKRSSPYYQAVVTLILRANEHLLKEERNMLPVLEEIFADELKRLEERGVIAGEKKGFIIGEKKGLDQGIELAKTVLRLSQNGISPDDIVNKYNITEDIVKKVLS